MSAVELSWLERNWQKRPIKLLLIAGLCSVLFLGYKVVRIVVSKLSGVVSVAAAPVQEQQIREVIGGTTIAQSFTSVAVHVAVREGRIKNVKVDLGSVAKAGDVLVEFDTDVFRETLTRSRLALEQARAELLKTEAERNTRLGELQTAVLVAKEHVISGTTAAEVDGKMYARAVELFDQQIVAPVDVELAKVKWEDSKARLGLARQELGRAENALRNEAAGSRAELSAARAKVGLGELDVAEATRDMDNTSLTAPEAGVIAAKTVDAGEWVRRSDPLFRLDRIDPIYAAAEIPQEKAAYVAVGQQASVIFDAFPAEVFHGSVAKIDPVVDAAKRSFKAFVKLENSESRLRAGMAAFTRLESVRRVLVVPRLAVINPTGFPSVDSLVFVVVDGNHVETRQVKVGKAEGVGQLEVLGGLKAGEWVVIHGQKDLSSGTRVTVEQVTPPAPSPAP